MRPLPWMVAAAALAAGGCSFLLAFDLEGLPCDADGGCLSGYGCKATERRCFRVADAGPTECACRTNERCTPVSKRCVPNNCANRRCSANQVCVEDATDSGCRPVTVNAQVGRSCTQDSDCVAFVNPDPYPRVCYQSAVPVLGVALNTGVCVELCPSGDAGCATPGLGVRRFTAGADGGSVCLCAPPTSFSPCDTAGACADDGLVCTVFDHASIGPATFCDLPQDAGVDARAACVTNTRRADGGQFGRLCKSGLCVPQALADGQEGVCGELCSGSSCGAVESCLPAELSTVGVVRQVPMCGVATRCNGCPDGGGCGIDAPHCTAGNDGGLRCMAACSPDAGPVASCPGTQRCLPFGAGFRCTSLTGSCG